MHLAVIQLHPDYSLPAADLRDSVLQQVRQQRGADLVVLPELWPAGGFEYEHWEQRAEPLDGPTAELLSGAARESGCWLHGGSILERTAAGDLCNTSLLFAPDGSLAATYRKIHLFGFDTGEPELLTAGTQVVTAETDLGTIGLATCYDLRFPELFRALTEAGAELVVVPAAWPQRRIAHWSVLLRARAIENQAVVVGCNTVGQQGRVVLGGKSAIVDARGEVVTEAGEGAEVISAEIDMDEMHRWRSDFPVLRDRRPFA
jgi:predicted amidohydrolase